MATILHIDHDDMAQKFIKSTLGHQYNVISASDGPTAIQYCAMIQPDLILLDLHLPDINGLELTSRLKMFMPQTPIVLSIQQLNKDYFAKAPVDGAAGLLAKPFDQDELWRTIHNLLPRQAASAQHLPSRFSEDAIEKFEAQIDALNQANKRLASLNAISALIGTSLDLENLTDEILRQIQKAIDFDSATLFLLKGNILEAAASRGLSDYRKGMNVFTKSDRNSAWRVVQNKLPMIINDVTKSDYWEPRPELSQVRSWLGVPLIFKDRVVGVLTLDKNQIDGFIEVDARFFFTLAYQMAIAVENAQLFEEWEDQATRLKLINEVSQEITTILDVNHVYEALAWAIFERLQYDWIAIFEVDLNTSEAILRAQYNQLSPNSSDLPHLHKTDLVDQVIKSGQPTLVNKISQGNREDDEDQHSIWAELAVPILVDNQIESVINVYSNRPGELNDQDLWTLSSLANQAATVIENARLYQNIDAYSERLERIVAARTQRLQAIKKISRVVSQGADFDELLAAVGDEIKQIFAPEDGSEGAINVMIGLITGSNLVVRFLNTANGSASTPSHTQDVQKLDYQTPAGKVIRQSSPIIQNNINIEELFCRTPDKNETVENSVILAPLIAARKSIGLIVVESDSVNTFDDSDLETLESVAFQIAAAIEHARLLRKTRELAIVDERTRLARDMHDGVAQNLAYLLIQVDRCLNFVDEGSKLEDQLEQISAILKQNIDELRRNIFDLRPLGLEGKSLPEVLKNFVAEFGRRWNLETNCIVQGDVANVSAEVESSLYRILQEALSNARKHAQCSQLWIELTVKDNKTVTLEVRDNGLGFDTTDSRQYFQRGQSKGLGLISMRERAESVGGKLIVKSASGQGTHIVAELPLKGDTSGDDNVK